MGFKNIGVAMSNPPGGMARGAAEKTSFVPRVMEETEDLPP